VPANAGGPLLGSARRWRGLTWVGWVNYLVLRWVGLAIWYTVPPDNSRMTDLRMRRQPWGRWM
jgi:hypothetical protein